VFGEYRKCIEGDYTYIENNCPSGLVTFADAVIRYYTPTCKTYKAGMIDVSSCIWECKYELFYYLNKENSTFSHCFYYLKKYMASMLPR